MYLYYVTTIVVKSFPLTTKAVKHVLWNRLRKQRESFLFSKILLPGCLVNQRKKYCQAPFCRVSLALILNRLWRCPRGVMVKAMDCGIVISEFVPQSRYYVHFQANTLGKGMNPLILPTMG